MARRSLPISLGICRESRTCHLPASSVMIRFPSLAETFVKVSRSAPFLLGPGLPRFFRCQRLRNAVISNSTVLYFCSSASCPLIRYENEIAMWLVSSFLLLMIDRIASIIGLDLSMSNRSEYSISVLSEHNTGEKLPGHYVYGMEKSVA